MSRRIGAALDSLALFVVAYLVAMVGIQCAGIGYTEAPVMSPVRALEPGALSVNPFAGGEP